MKKIITALLFILLLTACNSKTDNRGFYIEGNKAGINKITNTLYDEKGFDINGYDQNGFDVNGYDKKGFNKDGFDINGINKRGFDTNGKFHDKYIFEKRMKEKPVDYEKAKELMAKRYSLKNTYMYSAGKGEFETTKEYINRLYREQKNYLEFLADSYFIYDNGHMDINYNADLQEMTFTVFSFEDVDMINVDGKIEKRVRHFSLPFKKKEEFKLKMGIEEARNFDKSKIKIRMIISPMYEAILGDTRVLAEYGDKEKKERNITYDRKIDDYRSIIGYKIYDENKTYYDSMMDIKIREAFIKYAETLIESGNVQQRYPARAYIKNDKLHFVREEYIKNSFKNKFTRYTYDFKTKKIIRDKKIENYTSYDVRKEYKDWKKFKY